MKKFFSLLLLTAMTLSAWAATTFESGDLKYEVTTAATSSTKGEVYCIGLSTTGQSKTSLSITVPYIVNDGTYSYHCKGVYNNAFKNCTSITSARIMYGNIEVRDSCFYGCTNLHTVYFPSSIGYLANWVFFKCDKLTSIYWAALNMKERVWMVGGGPFEVSSKRTLYIPWGGDPSSYRFGSGMNSARIPYIKHSSMAYDYSYTDGTNVVVSTQPTETSLGEFTIIGFASTTGTTNVSQGIFKPTSSTRYPSSHDKGFVTVAVADSAFYGNTALKQLDLSNCTALTSVGSHAAEGCTAITSINIPAGRIEAYAFYGCTALSNITLDGVTYLGNRSFGGGIPVTTFNVPASLSDCNGGFLVGSKSVRSISVDDNNTTYAHYDGAMYNKARTILYRVPEGYYGSYNYIPATCTRVWKNAYYNCTNIKKIQLPYGVKTIDDYAFDGCTALELVNIPSSVTSLGDYLFSNCSSLSAVYINTRYAPTITKSNMFSGASLYIDLYTQRGMVDAFKSAGWYGFVNYNKDNVVASDYRDDALAYTVTSTKAETLDGTTFDGGRVKMVRGQDCASLSGSTYVPNFITINNKKYVVSKIDSLAFNSTSNYSITGCYRVDSVEYRAFDNQPITSINLSEVSVIGPYAFVNCNELTSVTWGRKLKHIDNYAFYGTSSLAQDVIMPVGFNRMGSHAFCMTGVKNMLLPSTTNKLHKSAFNGMSKLANLYINDVGGGFFDSSTTWDFAKVPTSCNVFVPVGKLSVVQAHSDWSRFTNIQEGAFDFAYNAELNSAYKMTVTSTIPVVADGVTYDGKAKYVYTPDAANTTVFGASNYETDKMFTVTKKYLMTEFGDSCLAGSTAKKISFSDMTRLTRIGKKAFYGCTNLTSADMPDNEISFGEDAFYGATALTEIVTRKKCTWDGRFYGNNASTFNFFVPYNLYYKYATDLYQYAYDDADQYSNKCDYYMAPCFTATATTLPLSAWYSLDYENSFTGTDVKANTISDYNSATNVATATSITRSTNRRAVLLTGLTVGNFYKIKRYFSRVTAGTNYLKTVADDTDISTIDNAYYWDTANLKFVKPTSSYTVPACQAYMVLADAPSEVYIDIFPKGSTGGVKGDLNGDGIVDITDVNMAINMVLGKVDKTSAGDLDGSGDVDITDVNLVINLMLGK